MNEDIDLDLEKQSINYFNNFMNKDLINLRKIFDDRVKLIDWNIHSIGIEKVLLEFETIFSMFNSIEVEINKIYISSNTAICDIIIFLDNNKLKVVDIITYKKDKIILINAYKQ